MAKSPIEDDDIPQMTATIHEAWHRFIEFLNEPDYQEASKFVGRHARSWSEQLGERYGNANRDLMERTDPLSRAFICLARGGVYPDFRSWDGGIVFLLAFDAIFVPPPLLDDYSVGSYFGFTNEDNLLYSLIKSGEELEPMKDDMSNLLLIERSGEGIGFNLMPFFVEKSELIDKFLDDSFSGDFEAGLQNYAEGNELNVDWNAIWTPADIGR